MQVSIPTPSGAYSPSLLASIFRAIGVALGRAMPTDEPVESFMLKAANGNRYRVTVSDTGALTTTAV